MFVTFNSNIEEKLNNGISATVYKDNSVSITFGTETMAGKLVPTGKMGQYQFYERIRDGKGYKYRPVSGALAICSTDGTLVFSFIPARLKRR